MATLFELKDEILKGTKIRLPHWYEGDYVAYNSFSSKFITENGEEYDIETEFLFSDQWEIYKKIIDYSKCIGCLCRFWNGDEPMKKSYGILTKIDESSPFKFYNHLEVNFLFCEPVKPEEIKFYDEED